MRRPAGKGSTQHEEQPRTQAKERTQAQAGAAGSLAPETLARTLRAVAAELERDPELARRVAETLAAPEGAAGSGEVRDHKAEEGGKDTSAAAKRGVNQSFRPRLVTGTDPALGSGIPDPYVIYARTGEAGLRAALADLRLGSLRAIVREHRLDTPGNLAKQNDAEKLRAAILAAAKRGE
jgi:hypothetical protein